MDVPQKDYHRKKPDAKEYTLHDFINRRGPEKKFINTERRSGLLGSGIRVGIACQPA